MEQTGKNNLCPKQWHRLEVKKKSFMWLNKKGKWKRSWLCFDLLLHITNKVQSCCSV